MPRQAEAELDYIAEPLRQFAVPIDSLTPDPDNPRLHDQLNLDAITASLTKFGQQIPIVVQQEGRIVRIGNGRLKAAKAMGWTHIAALITDQPDAVAKALGIADNRTAELAQWDMSNLARQLDELQMSAPDLIDSVGFELRQIESMITRYLPMDDEDAPPPPAGATAEPILGADGENPTPPTGNAGEGAAAPVNPVIGLRYIYLSYQTAEHDEFTELVRFFGDRYETAVTADAVLKALREFKESIQ